MNRVRSGKRDTQYSDASSIKARRPAWEATMESNNNLARQSAGSLNTKFNIVEGVTNTRRSSDDISYIENDYDEGLSDPFKDQSAGGSFLPDGGSTGVLSRDPSQEVLAGRHLSLGHQLRPSRDSLRSSRFSASQTSNSPVRNRPRPPRTSNRLSFHRTSKALPPLPEDHITIATTDDFGEMPDKVFNHREGSVSGSTRRHRLSQHHPSLRNRGDAAVPNASDVEDVHPVKPGERIAAPLKNLATVLMGEAPGKRLASLRRMATGTAEGRSTAREGATSIGRESSEVTHGKPAPLFTRGDKGKGQDGLLGKELESEATSRKPGARLSVARQSWIPTEWADSGPESPNSGKPRDVLAEGSEQSSNRPRERSDASESVRPSSIVQEQPQPPPARPRSIHERRSSAGSDRLSSVGKKSTARHRKTSDAHYLPPVKEHRTGMTVISETPSAPPPIMMSTKPITPAPTGDIPEIPSFDPTPTPKRQPIVIRNSMLEPIDIADIGDIPSEIDPDEQTPRQANPVKDMPPVSIPEVSSRPEPQRAAQSEQEAARQDTPAPGSSTESTSHKTDITEGTVRAAPAKPSDEKNPMHRPNVARTDSLPPAYSSNPGSSEEKLETDDGASTVKGGYPNYAMRKVPELRITSPTSKGSGSDPSRMPPSRSMSVKSRTPSALSRTPSVVSKAPSVVSRAPSSVSRSTVSRVPASTASETSKRRPGVAPRPSYESTRGSRVPDDEEDNYASRLPDDSSIRRPAALPRKVSGASTRSTKSTMRVMNPEPSSSSETERPVKEPLYPSIPEAVPEEEDLASPITVAPPGEVVQPPRITSRAEIEVEINKTESSKESTSKEPSVVEPPEEPPLEHPNPNADLPQHKDTAGWALDQWQPSSDHKKQHGPQLITWRSGPMEVQSALYGRHAESANRLGPEDRIFWCDDANEFEDFAVFEDEVRGSELEVELAKFAYMHTFDEYGGKGVIFMPAYARDINEGEFGASLETFWMTWDEARMTHDQRLLELIAEYDPGDEFLVFVYLLDDEDWRIIDVCSMLFNYDMLDRQWRKKWRAGHPMPPSLLLKEEYVEALKIAAY